VLKLWCKHSALDFRVSKRITQALDKGSFEDALFFKEKTAKTKNPLFPKGFKQK